MVMKLDLSKEYDRKSWLTQEGLHSIESKKIPTIVMKLDLSNEYSRTSWLTSS
jgi:hypothetical protein